MPAAVFLYSRINPKEKINLIIGPCARALGLLLLVRSGVFPLFLCLGESTRVVGVFGAFSSFFQRRKFQTTQHMIQYLSRKNLIVNGACLHYCTRVLVLLWGT